MFVINLNWIAALLGCVVLSLVCSVCRAGVRGVLLTIIGCAVIIGAVLFWPMIQRLLSLTGILLVIVVLAAILTCISGLLRTRHRAAPHYHPPKEMSGTCNQCAKLTSLKRYKQGWLCAKCARSLRAKAA